jgi:hypothetical protein
MAGYGSAYGATSWGYCKDNGSDYEGDCSADPNDTPVPGRGTPTSGCTNPSITCKSKSFGTDSSTIFSSDTNNNYYSGRNCTASKKIGVLSDFINTCHALTAQDCTPVNCVDIYGSDPRYNNIDFAGKQVYTNSTGGGRYFKLGCIQQTDPSVDCFPQPTVGPPTSTPTPTPIPSPTIDTFASDINQQAWSMNQYATDTTINGKSRLCITANSWQRISTFQTMCKNLDGVYFTLGGLNVFGAPARNSFMCCKK